MIGDLLDNITRAKTAVAWLAHLAQFQSLTVAQYVGEAVTKLEAARQQIIAERKEKELQR
jgi:hypothetical protein